MHRYRGRFLRFAFRVLHIPSEQYSLHFGVPIARLASKAHSLFSWWTADCQRGDPRSFLVCCWFAWFQSCLIEFSNSLSLFTDEQKYLFWIYLWDHEESRTILSACLRRDTVEECRLMGFRTDACSRSTDVEVWLGQTLLSQSITSLHLYLCRNKIAKRLIYYA